ncbi:MAG: hypothetical protein AB1416_12450 [Actinomycetota bacterium]
MYSRVTQLEIDTLRIGVDEAAAVFRAEVLPRLREMAGYEGVLVLTTPEGRGIIVSLWETRDALEAGSGFAAEQVARFMTLFAAPPGREHYQVALADLPGELVT